MASADGIRYTTPQRSYILEVIQNILAVVVESHFTTLFLINILAFMEWLFQEHCVILCTYWMVFKSNKWLRTKTNHDRYSRV